MKKLLALAMVFATICATEVNAQQGGGDPAAMMQRMKERVKPLLIEKTKITDAQADQVLEANFQIQRSKRELRMDQSISEEDKKKKNEELDASRNKLYKNAGLNDDQVRAVNTFFEEQRKEMQQRRQNGGGGNNGGN